MKRRAALEAASILAALATRPGFRALWSPEVFRCVVVLWILVFLYTGRSSVTESRVSFYVCHHKT